VDRLRLLFVVAHPVDYPSLNLKQEVKDMCTALDPLQQQGRLEYTIIRGHEANADYLQQILLDNDYHVFHFLGHGAFDDASGQGVLMLEGADGRGERLAAPQLARLLHDVAGIRLAFLNACKTAVTSETSPFASVAGALVKSGVPAVVASQYAISDKSAISFARKFYQALAKFHPLETAVAEGRKAIDISEKNYEWGVPVLYLRARDGRVL
jgi:CHAT domain-containing protein